MIHSPFDFYPFQGHPCASLQCQWPQFDAHRPNFSIGSACPLVQPGTEVETLDTCHIVAAVSVRAELAGVLIAVPAAAGGGGSEWTVVAAAVVVVAAAAVAAVGTTVGRDVQLSPASAEDANVAVRGDG